MYSLIFYIGSPNALFFARYFRCDKRPNLVPRVLLRSPPRPLRSLRKDPVCGWSRGIQILGTNKISTGGKVGRNSLSHLIGLKQLDNSLSFSKSYI